MAIKSTAIVRLNPAAKVTKRTVGTEEQPVLVIDDVLLDADDMVDFAAEATFEVPQTTYYPGLNANLPLAYLRTLLPVLRPTFARAFGIPLDLPLHAYGFYALATHGLDQLEPLQRVPHYDQVDPMCLAMVHYLCRAQGGGTGFFRHDASRHESITMSRRNGYTKQVATELNDLGERLDGFAGPDTPNYTLIDQVDIKFNRLVLYRSHVLHCALFDKARLSPDPRTGRLTANSFFRPQ